MKKWTFKKGVYDCTLTITDNADIEIKIDNGKPFVAKRLENGSVIFYTPLDMMVNGEQRKVGGFNLENYNEIKSYYDNLKEEIAQAKQAAYDKEFNDIMSGKKHLEITYRDCGYWSGYVAFGVSKDVIEKLHCGKEVAGYFAVDHGFEDGNIEKMKDHCREFELEQERKKKALELEKEEYEKEKAALLEGVAWNIEEYTDIDEGGKTKSYKHYVTINGKTYVFSERNIFDFGRVINPCYEIAKGIEGGLAKSKNGKMIWINLVTFEDGWQEIREMTKDEERAYTIVQKYGHASGIRM